MDNKPFIVSVDDDHDDQDLIQEALFSNSREVILEKVSNGQSLFNLLNSKRDHGFPLPDLILLDLNMPVLNGRETLVLLKSQGSPFRDIPVIILSTSDAHSDIRFCMGHGASKFLVKPNDFSALCRLMEMVMNSLCESGNTV